MSADAMNIFYDIEHEGDMEPYRDAIHEIGGEIVSENFNYDAEQWEVGVKKAIKDEYKEEVKKNGFWNTVERIRIGDE